MNSNRLEAAIKTSMGSADLKNGLESRPQRLDSVHGEIVRRVSDLFAAASQYPKNIPAPYRAGGEWREYHRERNAIYRSIQQADFDSVSKILSGFWRNELSPIVKEYAKYDQLISGDRDKAEFFITSISRNYSVWKEIFRSPTDDLAISNVGNPWGIIIDGTLVAPKACRYHAHATQIGGMTADIPHKIIGEIGAGYGGMANYLLRAPASTTYIDFDLPETLILAAYYLLSNHGEKKFFLYGEGPIPTGEKLKDYDVVLLPHYALPQMTDNSIDLMFNTFSLSEMPRETLGDYIKQIQRCVRDFFLHNNMDRTGVLNRGFERTPSSQFPIDPLRMKLIYRHYDLFHGHGGDYREFLYQRRT